MIEKRLLRVKLLNGSSFITSHKQLVSSSATVGSSHKTDKPQFPGSRSNWTEKLEFLEADAYEGIPVYRVMTRDGFIIDPSQDPNLGQEKITYIYKG